MRYIFIDTEFVVSTRFSYEAGALRQIQELVNDGILVAVMPKVTEREVIKKIEDFARHDLKKLRHVGGNSQVLGNSTTFRSALATLEEELMTELQQQWQDYLKAIRPVRIDHDGVHLDEILEDYFQRKPPFSKKPKEFVDGVAAKALLRWRENELPNDEILVVSADPDWEDVCRHSQDLLHVRNAKELFSLLAEDQTIAEEAKTVLSEIIVINATDEFPDRGFDLVGEWGEADDPSVTRIDVGDIDVYRVRDRVVTFRFDVVVHYEVTVSYNTYEHAVSDEGLIPMPWDDVNEQVERSVEVTGYGQYDLDEGDLLEWEDDLPSIVPVEPRQDCDY